MSVGEIIALIKAFGGGSGGGGTGGGVLVVNDVNGTLDKTYNEIISAPFAVLKNGTPPGYTSIKAIGAYGLDNDLYKVMFGNNTFYTAASENDYPILSVS